MARFAVETTPPIEETYPAEPNPVTVELSCVVRKVVEIKLRTDDANSVGSIKLLTYLSSPAVVDINVAVETYPIVPRPTTVETN